MAIGELGENQFNSGQMAARFVGHDKAQRMMQCLEGVDVDLHFPPLHYACARVFAIGMVDTEVCITFLSQRMIGSPIVAEDNC